MLYRISCIGLSVIIILRNKLTIQVCVNLFFCFTICGLWSAELNFSKLEITFDALLLEWRVRVCCSVL